MRYRPSEEERERAARTRAAFGLAPRPKPRPKPKVRSRVRTTPAPRQTAQRIQRAVTRAGMHTSIGVRRPGALEARPTGNRVARTIERGSTVAARGVGSAVGAAPSRLADEYRTYREGPSGRLSDEYRTYRGTDRVRLVDEYRASRRLESRERSATQQGESELGRRIRRQEYLGQEVDPDDRVRAGVEQRLGFDIETGRSLDRGGNIFKNVARESLAIATGLPAFGQMVGQGVAYPFAKAGEVAGVWGGGFTDSTEAQWAAAGQALFTDYIERYGALVGANQEDWEGMSYLERFRRFAEPWKWNFEVVEQQPLSFGLDFAVGVGALGKVAKAGSRAAGAAPGVRGTAAGDRLRYFGSRDAQSVAGRRYLDRQNRAARGEGVRPQAQPSPARAALVGREQYRGPVSEGGVAATRAADLRSGPDILPDPIQTPGRLYREPIIREGWSTGIAGAGEVAQAIRYRRPYSLNPITERVQRTVDTARAKIRPRSEAYFQQVAAGERRLPIPASRRVARRYTQQAKFNRQQTRNVRDLRYRYESQGQQVLAATPEWKQFIKAQRKIRKDPVQQAAVFMHVSDALTPRGGMTPRQQLDRAVQTQEAGLRKFAEANDVPAPQLAEARANIDALRRIPDDWLDLNSAPDEIVNAVNSIRNLDVVGQQRAMAAGLIDANTRNQMAMLNSGILSDQVRWFPDYKGELQTRIAQLEDAVENAGQELAEMQRAAGEGGLARFDPVEGGTTRIASAQREYNALRQRLDDAREEYTRARESALRKEPEVRRARQELENAEVRQQAAREGVPTRGDLRRSYRYGERAGRGAVRYAVAPQRRYGVGAQRAEAAGRTLRAAGAQYSLRTARETTPSRYVSISNETKAARDKLRKAERKGEENFTDPRDRAMVGEAGVYWPDKAVDSLGSSEIRSWPSGQSVSGPAKLHRTHKSLLRSGRVNMDPGIFGYQIQRTTDAFAGVMSQQALNELISMSAFTGPGGRALTHQRVIELVRSNPGEVVLVSRARFIENLRRQNEMPEGEWMSPTDVSRAFYAHGQTKPGYSTLDDLPLSPDDLKRSGEYFAISRAAADEWTSAMSNAPNRWLQAYDNAMSYWKGGILALSPRWYVNSLVGVAGQYLLLTGADVKSLFAANRKGAKGIREGMPAGVVYNTLARDIGFDPAAGGLTTPNRLQRAMSAGFELNTKMEGVFRRGAYLNRMKSQVRRSDDINFRNMSDEDWAAALDDIPDEMAWQVAQDVEFFMGDFAKMSPFERNVLRRFFPFYSWMRVIARLTFTLPFRSPSRVWLMRNLSLMGEMAVNPEDWQRPIWDRGAISIAGQRLRTTSANPAYTLAPFAEAFGQGSPEAIAGGVGQELAGWTNPAVQTAAHLATGVDTFTGRAPFNAPGTGGGAALFGREPEVLNPVTGLPERQQTRKPLIDVIGNAVAPSFASALRTSLTGNDVPYTSTDTIELLAARLRGEGPGSDPRGLFYDRKHKPVNESEIGWTRGIGQLMGLNVRREYEERREEHYRRQQRDIRKARISAAKQERRNRR